MIGFVLASGVPSSAGLDAGLLSRLVLVLATRRRLPSVICLAPPSAVSECHAMATIPVSG